MFDTVHLGSKGIAMFCLNVKNCIINKKGIDESKLPTTNQINHNKSPLGNLHINTKTLELVTIVEVSQLGVFNS